MYQSQIIKSLLVTLSVTSYQIWPTTSIALSLKQFSSCYFIEISLGPRTSFWLIIFDAQSSGWEPQILKQIPWVTIALLFTALSKRWFGSARIDPHLWYPDWVVWYFFTSFTLLGLEQHVQHCWHNSQFRNQFQTLTYTHLLGILLNVTVSLGFSYYAMCKL